MKGTVYEVRVVGAPTAPDFRLSWLSLDGRLFETEEGAAEAVVELLQRALPKYSHSAIKDSRELRITPTSYDTPSYISILPRVVGK